VPLCGENELNVTTGARSVRVYLSSEVGFVMADDVDFLDMKHDEIKARIEALRPLADEFTRLEAAAVALDTVPPPNGTAPAPPMSEPVKPARRTGGKRKPAARRGRPKGSGKRGEQALTLVRERPGITIPEMAEQLDMKQNYLYRVLPSLAGDGLVVKDGRGWRPKDTA
jgi:hypothetical protein